MAEKKRNVKLDMLLTLAMVALTSITLATATYAWFVNNATVTVDTVSFTATSSGAIEVAVPDTAAEIADGLYSTLVYKPVVSYSDAEPFLNRSTGETGTAKQLRIVSSADTTKFFLMQTFNGTAKKATNFVSSGISNTYTTEPLTDDKPYLLIPIFFRASFDCDVYLYTYTSGGVTTGTAIKGIDGLSGTGKDIVTASRIAFVTKTGGTTTRTVILEPSSSHITGSIDTTYFTDGGGLVNDNCGITELNADGTIKTIASQNKKALSDLVVSTTSLATIASGDSILSGKTSVFELTANTPQLVFVYVWLEGCDNDCLANITNGTLSIDLAFISAYK